ncbi:MAG TPA: hypothetical protein VGC55_05565 [Dokdonella sp.]
MTDSSPSLTTPWRAGILAILALVMLATRVNHFSALPDASWVVFFAAGFHLRGSVRWAFPLLMALAVAIDYFVISGQGLSFWSHYCVSPAYWFLIPSYGAMWFGGSWLRQHYSGLHARELGLLLVSVVVAANVCYLLTNGSFYWLSSHAAVHSFGGWMKNFSDWYLPYQQTTLIYASVAAVLHIAATYASRAFAAEAGQHARR